jgi:hypothetical protein
MSGVGEGEEETTLEFTPTWVVAAVCTFIVAISLVAERLLHYGGKFLKRKDQKPLYEALQKIKEGINYYYYYYSRSLPLLFHFIDDCYLFNLQS